MSSEKSVKIKVASEEITATHGMSTTMQEEEFSIYRNSNKIYSLVTIVIQN